MVGEVAWELCAFMYVINNWAGAPKQQNFEALIWALIIVNTAKINRMQN